jgi:hypothetical protein
MLRILATTTVLASAVLLTGCMQNKWHSPYRGLEYRMDQVMDGDPYREGDGNHQENGTSTIRVPR